MSLFDECLFSSLFCYYEIAALKASWIRPWLLSHTFFTEQRALSILFSITSTDYVTLSIQVLEPGLLSPTEQLHSNCSLIHT